MYRLSFKACKDKPQDVPVTSVCKICLQTGTIPIFGDTKHEDVSEDIRIFTGIEMRRTDEFTNHLCERCNQLLWCAKVFRKVALESDKMLMSELDEINIASDDENVASDAEKAASETDKVASDEEILEYNGTLGYLQNSEEPIEVNTIQSNVYKDTGDGFILFSNQQHVEKTKPTLMQLANLECYPKSNQNSQCIKKVVANKPSSNLSKSDETKINSHKMTKCAVCQKTVCSNLYPRHLFQYHKIRLPNQGNPQKTSCSFCDSETANQQRQSKNPDDRAKVEQQEKSTDTPFQDEINDNETLWVPHSKNDNSKRLDSKNSIPEDTQCRICKTQIHCSLYASHLLEKHGAKPQRNERTYCNICQKSIQFRSLKLHNAMKHKEHYQQRCDECGKDFYIKKKYEEHKQMHKSVKTLLENPTVQNIFEKTKKGAWLKCKVCDKSIHSGFMRRHVISSHGIFLPKTEGDKNECPICLKSMQKSSLKRHIMRKHLVKPPKLTCDTCGKVFHSKRNMGQHVLLHM